MKHDEPEESIWSKLEELAAQSSAMFLKKLSRNDTSWADDSGKHQAGFYIPREVRESGFFPPLSATNLDKPHIYFSPCISFWPQTGEIKTSGMRHYSNKGPETHFTVVPHDLFAGLSPASLLLAGRLREPLQDASHWFVVIDSTSEDAEILETTLNISSDFHFGLFDPAMLATARDLAADEAALLIDQLHHAIRIGNLDEFIQSVSRLPAPAEIAAEAQQAYFASTGTPSLDPYRLAAPGDAIMRISRDIEYEIFKRHELRRRASEVVNLLIREPDMITAVVRGFPLLDAVFLSASQQRKTRAGRSFEFHLATILKDGRIRFQEQAVLGGRRPDFVLPDKRTLTLGESRPFIESLVLSAKTTLRERWKQLTHERFNCAIFLATVDDRVSSQSLDEMQAEGIGLVVPESLKASKETFYSTHSNVMSFRQFFEDEIGRTRPFLRVAH
ncbi:type II restriction endonuclease [Lysobacter cavernae]|uniref:Type II restriction endonuclease n=1 Tax=Lysobacter cavernae TaxID=1685901 RepID=A0ABV7RPS5_9GAMM